MLVITSNYAARAFGIKKGDSLQVVRRKCPQIHIVSGEDLTFYRFVSQRVFEAVSAWSTAVEKGGMDELFVDLTLEVERRLAEGEAPGSGRDGDLPAAVVPCGFVYPS
eukprot:3944320-Prymnesium_polylepis.1